METEENKISVKVLSKNQHEFFFEGKFTFESLNPLWKTIFKNMHEIGQEFKVINEDRLIFSSDYQLIYKIKLATKDIELTL